MSTISKTLITSLIALCSVMVAASEFVGTWRNLSNGDYLELTDTLWNYYRFDADCDLVFLNYSERYYIDTDSTINGPLITSVSGLKDYYRQPIHCYGDSMCIGSEETWVRADLPLNVYGFSEYIDLRDSVETISFDSIFLFHVARLKHLAIKKSVTNLLLEAPCSPYPLELHLSKGNDSICVQLSSDITWMFRDDATRYIIHLQGRDIVVICRPECEWLFLTSRMQSAAIGYTKNIRCGKIKKVTLCDDVFYDSSQFYRSITIPHKQFEENRLRFFFGTNFAGYYGYDAAGERVYKLNGLAN